MFYYAFYFCSGLGYQNGNTDIADTAIKALEGGALLNANGNPSKSTLIIHSVQRVSDGNGFDCARGWG